MDSIQTERTVEFVLDRLRARGLPAPEPRVGPAGTYQLVTSEVTMTVVSHGDDLLVATVSTPSGFTLATVSVVATHYRVAGRVFAALASEYL